MDFRIRKDARKWFQHIKGELKPPHGIPSAPDFDAFYFCFVAGIATMQKKEVLPAETAPLTKSFPGPYKSRGRLLVGLFLRKELEYLGVSLDNKTRVRTAISKLVKPNAQNYLSEEGVQQFNKYAHGGYDVIQSWFDSRPRSLSVFVRSFRQKITKALSEEK